MEMLISLLIWAVVFAVVALSLLWICNKFFPEFPPARWICGGVLLIIVLIFVAQRFGSGFTFPR